jgi:Na+-driven multidrug efflux pump
MLPEFLPLDQTAYPPAHANTVWAAPSHGNILLHPHNKPLPEFRNDPKVIEIGTVALRWQIAVLPLHPLIVTTNMILQSTGHFKQATFLSCNRQGIYFIPLILILPKFFALFGIEIVQACSDFLSVLTAIPYLIWFMKKIKKIESKE